MSSSVVWGGDPPDKTVIRTRADLTDPGFIGWLHIDDHHASGHVVSRGNLGFRNTGEVREAIRSLMGLLPLIDRLAYLAPTPEMIGVEPSHAEDVLNVVDRGEPEGDAAHLT